MISRRAKIVCTIGPAVATREGIRGLIESGMDVARLNFSHGEHAAHGEQAELIRSESAALGKHVAILQDLCGPKIRTGKIGPKALETGDVVEMVSGETGDDRTIAVTYQGLERDVRPDDRILLSDGQVELRVLGIKGERVELRVEHGGPMRSKMGVNLPSGNLRLGALTEKDKHDLEFGLSIGVDYVALSFVRKAEEVQELRDICERRGRPTPIVAKIETPNAVERLDSIVRAADAAMVARGDLGVELPPETVPVIQKQIIGTCRIHRKPVIVATEMLQSMVDSPRPTRAEASDVAHAVFGGTDAVMLSAETAAGKYPVEVVEAMSQICVEAEKSDPVVLDRDFMNRTFTRIDQSIAMATLFTAFHLGAKAIASLTQSGSTALWMSRHNAGCPIFALTPEVASQRKMALYRNVRTFYLEQGDDRDQVLHAAEELLIEKGEVQRGDLVVLTIGEPMGKSGGTNAMKIVRVGEHIA